MGGEVITLTDGTKLNVQINFGTLYYMGKSKVLDNKKDPKKMTNAEAMETSAQVIYAILRSSGRTVTFDEALCLVPADLDDIKKIIEEFKTKLDKYKKKEEAKKNQRKFQSK